MPTPSGSRRADAVFSALAEPTRRRMIEILSTTPHATPTGLAGELPITRQAVAKHLAVLSGAGLVRSSRAGRETRYELDPAALGDAADWIASVGADWDDRLEGLRRLLERR